jgi:hypothetical protein
MLNKGSATLAITPIVLITLTAVIKALYNRNVRGLPTSIALVAGN